MSRKWAVVLTILLGSVAVSLGVLRSRHPERATLPSGNPVSAADVQTSQPNSAAMTSIYAHNLRLHQGPNFRVYVQWLRGHLQRAHKQTVPSFDDPESFYLNVTNGVIRANLGDICNYLNAQAANTPLRQINMTGQGDHVKITATFHKGLALPVQLEGLLTAAPNNRVQIHINKIDLLKVPMKGLFNSFHLTLANMIGSTKVEGLEINDNDLYLDAERLLPPPHIRGNLKSVALKSPDLEAIYGDVATDEQRVEQWRNFLRLEHGMLSFGKLIMRDVDLVMVDISHDDWFDLDLVHYQEQIVKGYTRMTPTAGLQIFMPDLSAVAGLDSKDVSIEWMKNRNAAPPPEVVPKH